MAWRGLGNSSVPSRGLRLRAHGLHLRAHGLLTRAHRLPLRAHGLALRAHGLLPRVRNYCQQRPVALSGNNLCAMRGDPSAVRGILRALMSNPFALRGNPCALRASPCALRDKIPQSPFAHQENIECQDPNPCQKPLPDTVLIVLMIPMVLRMDRKPFGMNVPD